jgi:hypothetical protein
VVERGFEAGIQLFEFLVALQDGAELFLQGILQMRNLVSREGLRSLPATLASSPFRTEGKFERTLTHVWPSLKSPQRFSNLPER